MPTIDSAVARLQDLAQACTSVVIKTAPDFPVDVAPQLPACITHFVNGAGWVNARTLQFMPVVSVDFLFSRTNLKQAYQQSDAVAAEFMQRLAGDPTLNGTVDTIQISRDAPVTFEVSPTEWGGVVLHMLSFKVAFKTLESPLP